MVHMAALVRHSDSISGATHAFGIERAANRELSVREKTEHSGRCEEARDYWKRTWAFTAQGRSASVEPHPE
jgi:hypothetical protein